MLPGELRELREGIFHSASEFAKLLGELREGEVKLATVQAWEAGRNNKPVPVWKTDRDKIKEVTKPISLICESCGATSVVRKNNADLCGPCAAPRTWSADKKLAAVT